MFLTLLRERECIHIIFFLYHNMVSFLSLNPRVVLQLFRFSSGVMDFEGLAL